MKNYELFHHEKIANGVIRITGAGNELMYLVIGENIAALIDSGTGVGNIKDYVETLTDLPLIVLLTHAHVDHSSGSFYFDKVFLTSTDADLLNHAIGQGSNDIFRNIVIEFVAATNSDLANTLDMNDIVTPYQREYEPLSHGDMFDLGGVTLEIIACPGHTHGSVMVLIKELRMIIFGDSCNPYVWLHLPESTSVPEYRNSLLQVKLRENDYDHILLSHSSGELEKNVLDELIHLCDDIMNETCDDIPFDMDGCPNAYVAKKECKDNYGIRSDGRIGNIIYKKE